MYDPDYVEGKVMGGIKGHLPVMKDLLSWVSEKATGKKSDLVTGEEDMDSAEEEERKT
jgi:hypothetical protein